MNKFDTEEVIKKLLDKYPNASILREKNFEVSSFLKGEFAEGEYNVYESPRIIYEFPTGVVVSRRLIQGKEKDPTIGIITPGIYEFNTGGNTETMTVLEGRLLAKVNEGPTCVLDNKHVSSTTAPEGTTLKLAALEDVFYLCRYKPKK